MKMYIEGITAYVCITIVTPTLQKQVECNVLTTSWNKCALLSSRANNFLERANNSLERCFPEKLWCHTPAMHRSSNQRCSIKKDVLEIFAKFIGKHLYQNLFFLIKKGLWHRCFPVNLVKFLRATFLRNTSGRLLLNPAIWKTEIRDGVGPMPVGRKRTSIGEWIVQPPVF